MSLLRTTRGGKPVDFTLANGGSLVGTAPGCQIVVADPAVAPKHCKIVRSPQGFVVTDLSGGAGTIVNGAKVKDHLLRDGDVLQVGAEKFVFADKDAPVAPAPKDSAGAPAGPARGRRPLPARPPQSAPRGPGGDRPAAPVAVAVRKLTAKPGSVARVHKDHAVFALPSTAKGRAIALSVGVGLVLLGGALFVASSKAVNSEDVKKKAKAEVEALLRIPETEIMKRYEMAGSIVSNEDYIKYAGGEIVPAKRIRNQLQPLVTQENRAGPALKPFYEKYKSLKDGPPEDYNKAADEMYEQAKVHLENFKTTSHGPRLTEIRNELKDFLEKRGIQTWRDEFPKLVREVQRMIKANNFSNGLVLVNNFGSQNGEKDSSQLKAMLQGERERLKDEAKSYVDKLKAEAAQKPTKEERRKHLEAGMPFVMGFPDVVKLLEQYIRDSK